MKKGYVILGVLAVALIAVIGYAASQYNTLVRLDQSVQGAWADVETNYQRRADLIPNLVNTVKGAAGFEQETLTSVIEARSKATSVRVDPENLDPERIAEFQAAQGELSSALGRLLAVAEAYPQLQATQSFRELQVQLEGTENRIAVSRRDFNGRVQEYNTAIQVFPRNIFAGVFGFDSKGFFEADAGAERAPEVNFGE